MKSLYLILLFSLNTALLFSQALSYTDPASGYLKLMLEKGGDGTYQQIGNFKVIGTSYLYGEKIKGSAYAGKDKSENIELSYNTYNQQLDVYVSNSSKAFLKPANEIDSFILYKSKSSVFKNDLLFYSSKLISPSIKSSFLQVVYNGKRFSLFKAYNSTLDYVSTNYIQAELRQFTLDYSYCYYDSLTKQFKKLKLNKNKIINEFKFIKDFSELLDDDGFNNNPEEILKMLFTNLNNN